jgi:hypothetical protein
MNEDADVTTCATGLEDNYDQMGNEKWSCQHTVLTLRSVLAAARSKFASAYGILISIVLIRHRPPLHLPSVPAQWLAELLAPAMAAHHQCNCCLIQSLWLGGH